MLSCVRVLYLAGANSPVYDRSIGCVKSRKRAKGGKLYS